MNRLRLITQGWANYVLDKFELLDPEIKELALTRIEICDSCPVRQGTSCSPSKTMDHVITGQEVSGCGCHIAAKAMAKGSKCPAGKW